MFPEIHRDQRSSIDSAPPSFTSMAIMVSDSDPEEGAQYNPSKLWTFGLSILPSYKEPLKLPQKITTFECSSCLEYLQTHRVCKNTLSFIWVQQFWGFHHCLQIRMRVDIARIFLSTWDWFKPP